MQRFLKSCSFSMKKKSAKKTFCFDFLHALPHPFHFLCPPNSQFIEDSSERINFMTWFFFVFLYYRISNFTFIYGKNTYLYRTCQGIINLLRKFFAFLGTRNNKTRSSLQVAVNDLIFLYRLFNVDWSLIRFSYRIV